MDIPSSILHLRSGKPLDSWPPTSHLRDFARSLDLHPSLPHFRNEFLIPTKSQFRRQTLEAPTTDPPTDLLDTTIYFCGNSLGLQPKLTREYISAYLETWGSIGVAGHFRRLEGSPITEYLGLAGECSRQVAGLLGAKGEEVVIMNGLTVNLHLMMAAFYRPVGKRRKVLIERKAFPSDYYAVESQITWHGLDPGECMLLLTPDEGGGGGEEGGNLISTQRVMDLIDANAEEIALILLPGIHYYSGQLMDIPTLTAYARGKGITLGWDLAHAAGNVELSLHDWGVDFACWCSYKYMNAGAGAISGSFVHEKHGDVVRNRGLKGWYGGDLSVRFQMDNKFVPTPGAQGFQISNPSVLDLTSLSASLAVFSRTTMAALRDRSLLLTAYAEHLLLGILSRATVAAAGSGKGKVFKIITPSNPLERGAQLSVLLREDLMDPVFASFEANAIVCDKRKPGVFRVAPTPLYNTFEEVWGFMRNFEEVVVAHAGGEKDPKGVKARL